MIVIMSDSKKETVGARLYEACRKQGADVAFISVSDRNVKPCYACRGCTEQTFGKCVVRDDMDDILPILLEAEPLVLCFPLTWGGLSFDMKKVIDKTSLIGDPFYKVKNGEVVKGWKGAMKHLIGVGVKKEASEEEKEALQKYMFELSNILGVSGKSHLVSEQTSTRAVEYLVKEVLEL